MGLTFVLMAQAGTDRSGTLLGSWHYQGAAKIRDSEGGDTFKRILSSEATAPIRELLVEKLAGAPDQLLYGLGTRALDTRVKLMSPLISDLIEHESYGEIHGAAASAINLSLAVKLPKDRQSAWNVNLRRYAGSLGWEVNPPLSEGLTSEWDATSHDSGFLMRYIQVEDWLLISAGADALTQILGWKGQLGDGKSINFGESENSWWTLNAEIETLQKLSDRNSKSILKSMTLEGYGDGEFVRSGGKLVLNEAMEDSVSKWLIPTNRIQEPVISFAAQRNIQPLLTQLPGVKKLFPQGVPQQSLVWARPSKVKNTRSDQGAAPLFLTYATWPVNQDEISVNPTKNGLSELLGEKLLNSGRMLLSSNEELNAFSLKIKPAFVQPFVQGIEYAGQDYHMAGLTYMMMNRTNPPPPSLFAQITKYPKLRYYHWERTDEKLFQYRNLINLVGFLFGKGQLVNDSPLFGWTLYLEEQLGNTVTQLLKKDANTLEIQRKSQLGLTGFEIALLARWMHSESFPWIDIQELSQWEFPAIKTPALKQPKPNAQIRR